MPKTVLGKLVAQIVKSLAPNQTFRKCSECKTDCCAPFGLWHFPVVGCAIVAEASMPDVVISVGVRVEHEI